MDITTCFMLGFTFLHYFCIFVSSNYLGKCAFANNTVEAFEIEIYIIIGSTIKGQLAEDNAIHRLYLQHFQGHFSVGMKN